MFVTHLAHVQIEREDPSSLKLDKLISKVLKRNEELATNIILSSLIDGDKKQVEGYVVNKIKKKNDFDERLKTTESFMKLWNHWRKFYFKMGPINPKTKGQITMIEDAIELANINNIKLTFFIACIHKAYVWRNVRPGYHSLRNSGLENYETYIEQVMVDIDKAERDNKSYG